MLCADLVDLEWQDMAGRTRRDVANLEDISLSGACVQMERPIPLRSNVRLEHGKGSLSGIVRYCVFREIGYFIGIEFEPGTHWSISAFRPEHMLDPRRLAHYPTEESQENHPVLIA